MYSIGQIEKITGIKSHILRYWEDVVPGFSPQKDFSGRRLYSQKDLELIFRIKYLTLNSKMTAENIGKQILKEAQIMQKNPEFFKNINEARNILTDLFFKVRNKNDCENFNKNKTDIKNGN